MHKASKGNLWPLPKGPARTWPLHHSQLAICSPPWGVVHLDKCFSKCTMPMTAWIPKSTSHREGILEWSTRAIHLSYKKMYPDMAISHITKHGYFTKCGCKLWSWTGLFSSFCWKLNSKLGCQLLKKSNSNIRTLTSRQLSVIWCT